MEGAKNYHFQPYEQSSWPVACFIVGYIVSFFCICKSSKVKNDCARRMEKNRRTGSVNSKLYISSRILGLNYDGFWIL